MGHPGAPPPPRTYRPCLEGATVASRRRGAARRGRQPGVAVQRVRCLAARRCGEGGREPGVAAEGALTAELHEVDIAPSALDA